MSDAAKYVLCRPQGGLNDLFNQIEKCRAYAERFKRILLVDTNYENAIHLRDDFGYYFVSKLGYMHFAKAEEYLPVDETSVSPSVLSGRLGESYPFNFDRDAMCYVESATKTPLTFDFSRDHKERVLIHQTGGGGANSIRLARHMQLSDNIAQEVVRRRGLLSDNYLAVHARNTDLISNYRPIIAAIKSSDYRGQVLVCTDDRNVVDEFQSNLKQVDVVSLANLETGEDRRIHFLKPSDDARPRNIDAICDLMLLALSNKLIIAPLLPNDQVSGGFSGFSLLAGLLNKSPAITWSLLGPAGIQLPSHPSHSSPQQNSLAGRTLHQ